eukprot:4783653-Amphidinium_carterae.1
MDEVVKTPLCPLLRLTKKLDIAIEWTEGRCLLIAYWKFQGRTAKQILMIEPEILAASNKLLTVVQEGKGKKRFAVPKAVHFSDVVSRVPYDMDNFKLISSEEWNASEKKKAKPLTPGVSNIHTIFTYQAKMGESGVKRLPKKLADKMVKL